MIHLIEDEWHLPHLDPNIKYQISLNPHIFNLIHIKRLSKTILPFDQIAYKNLCSIDQTSPRYNNADTSYAGIVVRDMPNPFNKAYRMIDGRHRLQKMINQKMNSGEFYILDYQDIKRYIYPI